jgi:hypothetical protein
VDIGAAVLRADWLGGWSPEDWHSEQNSFVGGFHSTITFIIKKNNTIPLTSWYHIKQSVTNSALLTYHLFPYTLEILILMYVLIPVSIGKCINHMLVHYQLCPIISLIFLGNITSV